MRQSKEQIISLYCEYLQEKLTFLSATEGFSTRGWPDRKRDLKVAFKLQGLLLDAEGLRLKCVFENRTLDDARTQQPATLEVIERRLSTEWGRDEENALIASSPAYSSVINEIETCRKILKSSALDGPLRAVQHDPDYIVSRKRMREAVQLLNKRLAEASR
jgi:hypothetical protein